MAALPCYQQKLIAPRKWYKFIVRILVRGNKFRCINNLRLTDKKLTLVVKSTFAHLTIFQNIQALREFRRIREKKENPGDVGGAPRHYVIQEKCFRNKIKNFPLLSGSFYRLRVHKRKMTYVPIHFVFHHQNQDFFCAYGISPGLGSYLMFNLNNPYRHFSVRPC